MRQAGPLTGPCLGLPRMSSGALSQIHLESSEREMVTGAGCCTGPSLGSKGEKWNIGDRRNPMARLFQWLCGNRHKIPSILLAPFSHLEDMKKSLKSPVLHLCRILEVPERLKGPRVNYSSTGKKKRISIEAKGVTLVGQHKGSKIQQSKHLPTFLSSRHPSSPLLSSCRPPYPHLFCKLVPGGIEVWVLAEWGSKELLGCSLLAPCPVTVLSVLHL